jgi:ubiquitin carboxyl-terminal hydrolase MINDY-1/2
MVTRKPLPQNATIDPASQVRMQPVRQQSDPENVWGANAQQQQQQQQHQQQDALAPAPDAVPAALRPGSATSSKYSDLEEENVWADSGAASGEVNRVPTVLRPGGGKVAGAKPETGVEDSKEILRVPTVLRPGGKRTETNPFKRTISSGDNELRQSSNTPPIPSVPTASFSQLSVSESNNNPWQPALEEQQNPAPAHRVPSVSDQDIGNSVWDSAKPSRQATPGPTSNSPALISLPSDTGSAGWEDEGSRKEPLAPPPVPTPSQEVLEDSHAWDDLGSIDKGKAPAKPPPFPNAGSATADDWNLIDVEGLSEPPPKKTGQSAWDEFIYGEQGAPTDAQSSKANNPKGEPPELPPRKSQEGAPLPPPRPVDKSETYQIKNINWYDVNAAKNPRTSPILVQNANGPCPLVALVNALILTTPAEEQNTALVETLRSRENVSLELLLRAVFEELMSERRMREDTDLPDMTDLYNFLKGLHTGMNVNPRFIPLPEIVTAFKRTSLTHLHPTERVDLIPGTFEYTKEMALYATFAIPLIHGWLPAKSDAVYASFERQAASYEDAQNLLFREEELEEKLSSPQHEGLTEGEQQIYQDVLTIKSFLSISATQLTKWGLEVIRKSMMPGSVVILFRNDHFSTLYKHPQTHELLTLVTDAGYANHAEVVWESLVDVNGERAEFFSGDFRLVGGAPNENQHRRSGSYQDSSRSEGGAGWTTAQGRRGRNQSSQQGIGESDEMPLSPGHEQEDRDLALALQLQEEEDQRHRTEQERRRRESLLSEQFIEQQARTPASGVGRGGGASPTTARRGGNTGRGGSQTSLASAGPPTPNRRSSNVVNVPVTTTASPTGLRRPPAQTVRSLIPPRVPATNRAPDDGVDDAPPSYEQAAKQPSYVPPAGHPSHPSSAPVADGGPPATGTNTSGAPQGLLASGPPPATGRRYPVQGYGPGPSPSGQRLRPGVPPAQMAGSTKDRDCVVM